MLNLVVLQQKIKKYKKIMKKNSNWEDIKYNMNKLQNYKMKSEKESGLSLEKTFKVG